MSKDLIDKNLIDHLAGLAKIKLEGDSEKLTNDLKEIVGYFENIKEVSVENINPVSGGTDLINITRGDVYKEEESLDNSIALDSFPEKKDGYSKTPPVFNHE
jgi:aspartyl/glutamyl-tRNA(Asn/Gln) amidotransferase C subunit